MNKLAAISLVVFLQAMQVAQAASQAAGKEGGESPSHRAAAAAPVDADWLMIGAGIEGAYSDVKSEACWWEVGTVGDLVYSASAAVLPRAGGGAAVGRTESSTEVESLYHAAANGDADVVRRLLGKGAKVDETNAEGETALHGAAKEGWIELVEALLKGGANMTIPNKADDTPLLVAVANGRVGVVEAFLAAGANVNETNGKGMTALHVAAREGKTEVVRTLLAAKGVKVNEQNVKQVGYTALHFAAWRGHADVVDLLATKANVDELNADGSTALHVAAANGHVGVVEALLKRGANVTIPNKADDTPLHVAAANGHVGVVEAFLAAGANVNETNGKGMTTLYVAAANGCAGVVEVLIAAKANVNKPDARGNTALHVAVYNRYFAIVGALLDAGADLSMHNANGNTALSFAAFCGDVAAVEALLHAGADPSLGKIFDKTPLQYAASKGNGPVANLIMHALISQKKPVGCLADDSFFIDEKPRIFMHILAQGGEHFATNIRYLLETAQGLSALSLKTADGKLLEDMIVPAKGNKGKKIRVLKERIKALREGYALFKNNLDKDVSRIEVMLEILQPIARYITGQSKDSGKFPLAEWEKAQSIIADFLCLKAGAALDARINDATKTLSILNSHIGQQARCRAGKKSEWNGRIIDECILLGYQYAAVLNGVTTYSSMERVKLSTEVMKKVKELKDGVVDLCDKNSVVNGLLGLRESSKAAVAGGAGGGAAAAASGRLEGAGFEIVVRDMETLTAKLSEKFTADLNVETLTSLASNPKIMPVLKAKMEARGQNMELSENLKKRWGEWINDFVTNYEIVPSYQDISREVYLILRSACARNIDINFIVGVLNYSTDTKLHKAFTFISNLHPSDAATYVSRSVHDSLGGEDAMAGFEYDGGSMMGGTVGAVGRLEEVDDCDEDACGDEGEKAVDMSARFSMPPVLAGDIHTLVQLFNHDYENIDETGGTVIKLFKALGNGFDGSAEAGVLKFRNPKGDTVTGHFKHDGGKKGLNKDLGKECLTLLKDMGIEQEDVTQLALRTKASKLSNPSAAAAVPSAFAMPGAGAKPGRGGSKSPSASGGAAAAAAAVAPSSAAAAAASASSRTSGYSDYASGGGGGGAVSGGGGGGWNAARGAYTYELPGK